MSAYERGLPVSNDFGWNECENQCQKQQPMEVNKNMNIGALKC